MKYPHAIDRQKVERRKQKQQKLKNVYKTMKATGQLQEKDLSSVSQTTVAVLNFSI